jgi:flagellin-like protein
VNYKAISPIISTIILVLLTIAISTTAYYWMMEIQQDLQQGVSGQIEGEQTRGSFTINSMICESASNNITLTLINDGSRAISSGTAIIILKDASGIEISQLVSNDFPGIPLEPGQLVVEYEMDYDLISLEDYSIKLTLPFSDTRTRSCRAQ